MIDLDHIEQLTLAEVDATIDRAITRLSALQGLRDALARADRQRVEAMVREYHRAKAEERRHD